MKTNIFLLNSKELKFEMIVESYAEDNSPKKNAKKENINKKQIRLVLSV